MKIDFDFISILLLGLYSIVHLVRILYLCICDLFCKRQNESEGE